MLKEVMKLSSVVALLVHNSAAFDNVQGGESDFSH
jgi:hypothetical protein